MSRQCRARARVFGEGAPVDVIVRDCVVVRMEAPAKARPDVGREDAVLGPTLVDIQVNGAAGIDLGAASTSPEDVARLSAWLAVRGVACWFPTLVTAPQDQLEACCRTLAEALSDPAVDRAAPAIHLEGPAIAPEDGPRGAHPRPHVRPPSLAEFDRLQKAAGGRIRCVTLAPEIDGAEAFIRGLVARGVVPALGHHAANAADVARAADAGARLCTHLGNGLAPRIHRHHNPLWPQLADDRLAASFIADLHHLPAPMLRAMLRAKGPARSILASDCVHLAGLAPGRYTFAGAEVDVTPRGRACLAGTDLLAGSTLLLLQGVLNAAREGGLTLRQAFACASTIPARLFAIRRPPFPPREGRPADFLVVQPDAPDGLPDAVWIAGRRMPLPRDRLRPST